MDGKTIWSVASAIIVSLGGAGVIISAVLGFTFRFVVNRMEKNYQQRQSKELEKYRYLLENHRYITKSQYDREFEIYRLLSKHFFMLLVVLYTFTSEYIDCKIPGTSTELDEKTAEFQHLAKVLTDAQSVLYENAPFIPQNIFTQYVDIYWKSNELFWVYNNRIKDWSLGKIGRDDLVTEEEQSKFSEIEKEAEALTIELRNYLSSLAVAE
ncbi:MAG: hypothetical protein J1E60_00510 [Christensenellaceae bacterium]|nr:hypothetical protein [Christensenellaceae bacterium]